MSLVTLLLFLTLLSVNGQFLLSGRAATSTFSFAASGDLGMEAYGNASYRGIPTTSADFFLALGDLSYNDTIPESRYCDGVKELVGPSFPFEVLSGNHEDGEEVHNGLIDNFAQCLPDRLGVTGTYGKEYFFDYPATGQLARFILISPDLTFTNGGRYSYDAGTSHYDWLASTIDSAPGQRHTMGRCGDAQGLLDDGGQEVRDRPGPGQTAF